MVKEVASELIYKAPLRAEGIQKLRSLLKGLSNTGSLVSFNLSSV